MKINSTGIYQIHKQANSFPAAEIKKGETRINREFVYASYPIAFGCNPANLDFLSGVKVLHCVYCGEKLIHPNEFKSLDFSSAITSKAAMQKLKHRVREIIQSPQMKMVFSKMKSASSQPTSDSFKEISEIFGLNKYSGIMDDLQKSKLQRVDLTKAIIKKLTPFEKQMPVEMQDLFQKLRLVLSYPKIKAAASKQPDRGFDELLNGFNNYVPIRILESLRRQKLEPGEHAGKIIDVLKSYEDTMKFSQKEVFQKLKTLHIEHPEESVEALMLFMRPEALQKLHLQELNILDSMTQGAKDLSEQTAKSVLEIINNERNIINGPNSEQFKRRAFIFKIKDLMKTCSDEDCIILIKMRELASNLPTSTGNPEAFIVKYSEPTMVDVGGQMLMGIRSGREIAQSLLKPSENTLDHVIPQHVLKDLPKTDWPKGNTNYASACGPCNHNAKGGLNLELFLKKHPKAKNHIINHINEVFVATYDGQIADKEYPAGLANNFIAESGGIIKRENISFLGLQ